MGQHVEAENLIKDLQARLRAQGAAHVADLEYLADAEARASALVTAAADALKAKDAELNQLRERLAARMASSSSSSSVSSGERSPTQRPVSTKNDNGYTGNVRRIEPGQAGPPRPKSKAAASGVAPKSTGKSEDPV